MEEWCEYLLQVAQITDTSVGTENKRWYRVKWKSMWISDQVISPKIFQKTQNGRVHIIGKNMSYEILQEKPRENGNIEFLLSCADTWEAEEKLKVKFAEQISAFWTSKSINANEIIKIEEADDDGDLCMRNGSTGPCLKSMDDLLNIAPQVKDENSRYSQCCSVTPTNLSNSSPTINDRFVPSISSVSNSCSPSSLSSANEVKTENGHEVNSCSGSFHNSRDNCHNNGNDVEVVSFPSLTDDTLPAADRFSPSIIRIEDDFPNISIDDTTLATTTTLQEVGNSNSFPYSSSSSITETKTPIAQAAVMIEKDDFSTVFDRCVSDTSMTDTTTTTMEVIDTSTSLLPNDTLTQSIEGSLQRDNTPPVIVIQNGSTASRSPPSESLNGIYHVSSSLPPLDPPHVPSAPVVIKIEDDERDIHTPPHPSPKPNGRTEHVTLQQQQPQLHQPLHVQEQQFSLNNGISIDQNNKDKEYPNQHQQRQQHQHQHQHTTKHVNDERACFDTSHSSNSPPPLISVSSDIVIPDVRHSPTRGRIGNRDFNASPYQSRHLQGEVESTTVIPNDKNQYQTTGINNNSSLPRPQLLAAGPTTRQYDVGKANGHRVQENQVTSSTKSKDNEYQIVITNGTSYKCEICGREFMDFNEICEHRKSHRGGNTQPSGGGSNRLLSPSAPIKIEDDADSVDFVGTSLENGATSASKDMLPRSTNLQYHAANSNVTFHQPIHNELHQPLSRSFNVQPNPIIQSNHLSNSLPDYRRSQGGAIVPPHAPAVGTNNKEHFFSKSFPPPNPVSYMGEYPIPGSNISQDLRAQSNLFKPASRERSAASLDSYLSAAAHGQSVAHTHAYHSVPVSPEKAVRMRHMSNIVDPHYYPVRPKNYHISPSDHMLTQPHPLRKGIDPGHRLGADNIPYPLQPRIVTNSNSVRGPHPINHLDVNRFPPRPGEYLNSSHVRQHGFAPPQKSQPLHKVSETEAMLAEKQRMLTMHNPAAIKFRGMSDVTNHPFRPPLQVQQSPYYPPSSYPRSHLPNDLPPTLTKMPGKFVLSNGEIVHQPNPHAQISPPMYAKCDICGKHFSDFLLLKEHRATHVHEQLTSMAARGIPGGIRIKEEPDADFTPSTVHVYRKDGPPTEIVYPAPDQHFPSDNNHHMNGNGTHIAHHRSPHHRSPISRLPGQPDNNLDSRRFNNPENENVDVVSNHHSNEGDGQQHLGPSLNSNRHSPNENPTMVDSPQRRGSFFPLSDDGDGTSMSDNNLSDNGMDKIHKCESCNLTFEDYARLKEHRKMHIGEKQFSCELCDKTFTQNSTLKRHQRTHTREKPYQCEICGKSFSHNYNLKEHGKTHTGEKPYKCNICNKTFAQNYHLKEHFTTHSDAKPFKCDKCNKQFSLDSYLKKHMKIHTGEKPYKCDVCDKQFLQNSHLKDHRRIHTGEKPFRCEICGIRFSQNYTLKIHQRTHTGEKPYKCEVCNKRFSQNSHLKEHRTRTHSGDKPFKCDQCHKEFSLDSYLKKHQKIHSGEKPFKCDVCGKQFSQNYHLKEHRRIHTGEKPYKCQICEMRFSQNCSLKIHQRIHTGEKPYECEICHKHFSHSSNVKTHKRVHLNEKNGTNRTASTTEQQQARQQQQQQQQPPPQPQQQLGLSISNDVGSTEKKVTNISPVSVFKPPTVLPT